MIEASYKKVVMQARCPICDKYTAPVQVIGTHVVCQVCGTHSDITMRVTESGSIAIEVKENLKMFKE